MGIGVLALAFIVVFPAQAADKTEVNIRNLRSEPITMRFSYVFMNHAFTLMRHEVTPSDDLSYRFPVGLPGCATLQEWGIADGTLTISDKDGVVCEHPVSLCARQILWGDVRLERCTWRNMLLAPP